jgi:hypothetical protein
VERAACPGRHEAEPGRIEIEPGRHGAGPRYDIRSTNTDLILATSRGPIKQVAVW